MGTASPANVAAFFIAFLIQCPFLLSAGETHSTLVVKWADGAESPAVCVEKSNWFISIPPASIEATTSEQVTLIASDESGTAKILYFDKEQGLCLLESKSEWAQFVPLTLSKGKGFKPGDRAKCLSGEMECGTIVAGKDWSYRGERFPLPLLRLRVSEMSDRCIGGTPLVNGTGELMAILTGQRLEADNEMYAIPVSRVRKLIEDVKHNRRSGPVWVGLVFHAASTTPEVIDVKPKSPAAAAGIEAGDLITAVNEVTIRSLDDLIEAIHNLSANQEAKIEVLRGVEAEQMTLVPTFAKVTATTP